MPINIIGYFRGKSRFLSNFYPSIIRYKGILYPTVEHAYQSQKIIEEDIQKDIRNAQTPKEAKQLGKLGTKRDNWDTIKYDLMKELLRRKFLRNSDLKKMLIETNDAILIEGNIWHDNEWGNCYCEKCKGIEGKNLLGKILMEIREDLLD